MLTARFVEVGGREGGWRWEEEDGGERRESGADFDGGGKLEREL